MLRSAGHGADAPAGLLPSFSPGAGGDYGGFAAMRERLAGGPQGLGCGSRAQHRLWGTLATGACAALLVSQTLSDMGGIVCWLAMLCKVRIGTISSQSCQKCHL
jgi:hypothetical protein